MKIKFPKFIKSKKIVAMLLILVAIAVTIFIVSKNRAKNVVDRATIQKGEVAQELILSGEIVATEHAQLVFPASGEIAWVNVKEGDWVKKGTALTSLNKTVLAATYQQALNNVRRYEANVDYVHDSLKDKDSTETFAEIDTRTTAEVAKDNAYDALRIAEYNLRNATLTAPFEGLVTYVAHPYSGVNVSFTETQIELINPSTIYFKVSADQTDVTEIVVDQEVNIVLDSFSNRTLKGNVSYISLTPIQNEVGSVYEVKVTLESSEDLENVRIGMTGDAKFILKKRSDVLFVPPDFVNSDKTGKFVSVGDKKNKVYVEVGFENEEQVEIAGDIKEGDIVVD